MFFKKDIDVTKIKAKHIKAARLQMSQNIQENQY
jgi:hypothetical protein